jgi:hypothetical protein
VHSPSLLACDRSRLQWAVALHTTDLHILSHEGIDESN